MLLSEQPCVVDCESLAVVKRVVRVHIINRCTETKFERMGCVEKFGHFGYACVVERSIFLPAGIEVDVVASSILVAAFTAVCEASDSVFILAPKSAAWFVIESIADFGLDWPGVGVRVLADLGEAGSEAHAFHVIKEVEEVAFLARSSDDIISLEGAGVEEIADIVGEEGDEAGVDLLLVVYLLLQLVLHEVAHLRELLDVIEGEVVGHEQDDYEQSAGSVGRLTG